LGSVAGARARVGGTRVAGTILETAILADEKSLYKLLMTVTYDYVKAQGIWAILRLFMRLMMASITSEQLAEMICSFLTNFARKGGRPAALQDIVNGVRLRCAGLAGNGRDQAFVSKCLDAYFRVPKGEHGTWHFWSKNVKRDDKPESRAVATFRGRDRVTGLQDVVMAKCVRRNLLGFHDPMPSNQSQFNPRAGRLLRRSDKLSEMRALLGEGVNAFAPDAIADSVQDFLKTNARAAARSACGLPGPPMSVANNGR